VKESMLDHALRLAEQGFHVFPLGVNSKKPFIADFPNAATTDPEQIKRWWTDPVMEMPQPYNIGISTTKFGSKYSLVAVDVDNKGNKKGDEEIMRLEREGKDFPETYLQETPTGGRHFLYLTEFPVSQGVNVLGKGLDIRGRGGYVVGAGSMIDGKPYKAKPRLVSPAPKWLVEACGRAPEKNTLHNQTVPEVNKELAIKLAIEYLKGPAPLSIKGEGGDATAYQVAARVKDFGVDANTCLDLMLTHWNVRSPSQWTPEKLEAKVRHAYRYGQEPIGATNPELQFDKLENTGSGSPFDQINREYAFIMLGGGHQILWETKDAFGKFRLELMSEHSFHRKLASKTLQFEDKTKPVTELWMKSSNRRSYDGLVFEPGLKVSERYYNLWRGFSVEPAAKGSSHKSVDMLLEHVRTNVCKDNEDHFKWLISYFAHLIQKPFEKPLVALVFKGRKGVGKNAMVESIGNLLGQHFLLTAKKRYLTGNFNSHLQNCLLLALDEAFWSGDKESEGVLKDLITGKTHLIEMKGKESYPVKNCARVCIIGNESWVVPASEDERRFAVFEVGEGRKNDLDFFQTMREGFESGGASILLRFLLDYDIADFKVNSAPKTSALLEQKISSLDVFYQWWFECLMDGKVSGLGFDDSEEWQQDIVKEELRSAYSRYVRERNIRSRIPDAQAISRLLLNCIPSVEVSKTKRLGSRMVRIYRLPTLEKCRESWDKFIGHPCDWPPST
jgi:hypothetical protein